MNRADPAFFQIRLATTPRDLMAAQRLRYRVFVEELGGTARWSITTPGWNGTSSTPSSTTCA